MKQMLVDYARYNLWANENLITLFRSLDDAQISQTIPSSFPSIRATLLHIWDAESLWLERLKGVSPTTWPSSHFSGANSAVFEVVLKTSKELIDFSIQQPAPFYREKKTFLTLSDGVEQRMEVVDMMHHTFNHSTFHRGQLVMMARQLGVTTIPRTDFIIYRREN
jgi:uncharacterized damage-inducible protein DinB